MIECIMATASVQQAPGNNLGQVIEPLAQDIKPAKQDVATELYYYKDSDDGTPPAPAYVGWVSVELKGVSFWDQTISKPVTYLRPHVAQSVTVHDIAGDEDKYSLDSHGFQFVKHESKEKDFLEEEKIKAEYYPETEQLLKDVWVSILFEQQITCTLTSLHSTGALRISSLTTQSAVNPLTPATSAANFAAQRAEFISTSPTEPPRTVSSTVSPMRPASFPRSASRSST
jgi:hypothetical protein